jgi:hypothetical protein
MKWKIRVVSVALSIILSLALLCGCAPGVPSELKPCEVKVDGVYPLQLGAGSIDYEVVFSIYNPNPIMVVLDTLEWNISTDYVTILDEVETAVLARRLLLDDVYIPANTEVKVTSAFAVAMATVIGEVFMEKGSDCLLYLPQSFQDLISSGQMPPDQAAAVVPVGAIACMFSLWKLVGASRPPIDPNMDPYLELVVWDGSAEGPPLWTVTGTASFLSAAGSKEQEFSSQWQAE